MDFVDIPAIIANRLLKRQPLNVVHVKKQLLLRQMQQEQQPRPELPLLPPPIPQDGGRRDDSEEARFEDGLSVTAFLHNTNRTHRTISDPPKI